MNKIRAPIPIFKLLNLAKEQFECPICHYSGPFRDFDGFVGQRDHAICPKCNAMERHRLQYLVLMDIHRRLNVREMKMLHFAPEQFFKEIFSQWFRGYETADLFMRAVDHKVDIRSLPFKDATYDFIFASHVLEHISDDKKAIQEVGRILRPNGLAILPVPVVCPTTIEYPHANPAEIDHVRACGTDYFERYKEYFSKVKIYTSESFPEKYQTYVYEDRSVFPTEQCPLRPPMQGKKHLDFVPACYA